MECVDIPLGNWLQKQIKRHICYSIALIYKRPLPYTQCWLGFQLSCPRLVDLVRDFLLTRTLSYLPFGKNGCKSRFIGIPSDAPVNVHRCLRDNGLFIIDPFLKKIIIKKILTTSFLISRIAVILNCETLTCPVMEE